MIQCRICNVHLRSRPVLYHHLKSWHRWKKAPVMRTYDAFDFSKIRKEYSRVRLRTDRFANKNIPIGTIGAIIEIFCNGENMNYFVDFVDAHGDPLDWIEVGEEDIEPA